MAHLERATTHLGQVTVKAWRFDEDEAPPKRVAHATFELSWCEERAIHFRVGSREAQCDARVMLLPPGVEHATWGDAGAKGVGVHFAAASVEAMSTRSRRSAPITWGVAEDPRVLQLARLLAREEGTDAASQLMSEALIDALIVAMLREGDAQGGCAHPPLRRAIEYAHAHFRESLRVEQLAEVAHMSRAHFSRAFRAMTTQSPHDYIATLRLEEAAAQLRKGASVSAASFDVGYQDMSRFAAAFRKRFGVSPSVYRSALSASR